MPVPFEQTRKDLLATLTADWKSIREITDESGSANKTKGMGYCMVFLDEFVAQGLVEKAGTGRRTLKYRLTEAGLEHVMKEVSQ